MTVKPYNTGQTKKEEVREMFDNIAPKYDLLNHTLSMNIDRIWRRRVVRIVCRSRPHRILDVATGTGDLAIEMARRIRDVHVLGVDLSEKMLDVARCKVAARGLDERVVLDVGDAEHLRVSDASVDVVTVAFGVRNFGDLEAGLREMARTIKPGGKVVILEFSRPRNRLFRLSSSLSGLLTPVLAMALMTLGGLRAVMFADLATFAVAFTALLCFIRIPKRQTGNQHESFLDSTRQGLRFFRQAPGLLALVLYLAAINLVSSMYEAALPSLLLSRSWGGETAMGIFSTVTALATLIGSLLAVLLPAPKSRVRVVCGCLLVSMGTENFLLAFGRNLPTWCVGAALGWLLIPVMSANLDALMRLNIPEEMQGRVYAVRNALQFFTIPVGYVLGGALVDAVFRPMMRNPLPWLEMLFGRRK